MEARSIARYVRVTPRKVDQVLRLIRGMQVDRAQEVLGFTPRPIARQVSKVLKSAVANAAQKEEELNVESLYVKTAIAGAGPIFKRYLPRAHGRATRFWKRTSHITIVVTDGE
ncbi:MAG: 50S ribosomal protein L22 [Candidatus Eisenbacteria bacterium]|nr:50S ribosomal protein L22 [Candidatus Latescibacterota bacterium]MBD3302754.1 50S ribosomal protein L22 [Candidatus Eisenbacteria bacterium]